jgi:hypothetical protein
MEYDTEITCWNCKKVNYIRGIPQGTSVKDHIESLNGECNRCGCLLIKPKEEKKDDKKGKN